MEAVKQKTLIILGDVILLAVVTLVGFANHNELTTAGLRMLATFLPLVIAWFFVAPGFGAFREEVVANPRRLWVPAWAMLAAVPLATFLRGVWLNQPIIPIFVAVMTAVSTLGILIWRGIYFLLLRKKP